MKRATLPEAITEAFEGLGLNQVQVAQRMGVDQTTISRLANGKWGERGGPTPDQLAKIEDACGRPRGWILHAAGYVENVASVPAAIAMDPDLSADARRVVLGCYESVKRSTRASDGRE